MTSRTRVLVACGIAAIMTASAFAQLSAEKTEWAKGPAQYLLTEEETAKWKQIKTDAEAQAFIDLYWARRDPTPNTPANEFRAEFDARVEYADRQFGQARKKGSMTDRGRILVTLGAPTRIERTKDQPSNTIQSPTGSPENYSPKQVWIWEQSKSKLDLGQPTSQIGFVDQYATNEWVLERTGRTDVATLTKRTIKSYVVSPNMTEVPKAKPAAPAAAATPQQLPTPTTPTVATNALKTEGLRTAVTEFRAAKTNPYKPIAISFTELLSPTGDQYVPVQLYIPASAGLTAESVTTFFGVIEDATGNQVATFEEPAKLSASKGDLYFDKSLKLDAGKYTATLGLSGADGKPVVIATSPMEIRGLDKTKSGVSRLVLAADVHETPEAALVGAPYAFGRLKIVPKGDAVFTNKDELTYFLEVVNPGIDETTTLPKLQVKLELVGNKLADGKPGRTISAPISDASALPLSGVNGAGQYAVIAGIPLGEMKNPLPAGDYTMRVKIFDKVKNESWTSEQKLKIVAAK
ncbi:MAG: GWxTD domain-containing protein [Thermoanaerobaculia bacterium]|nr:GWxTD domain-containing protein [Thermoanaerobaculia bacterium]